MIEYISDSQLSIEEFKTPFQNSLDPDNRWVKLSKAVNWDKFASLYISAMNTEMGRPGVCPRIVLGALIIKHKEKLDDRGTIAAIQENVYMQYFVGLKEFSSKPVFDSSLLVTIRKRVGANVFDKLNEDLIKSISKKADLNHQQKNDRDDQGNLPNKGKMQADATVADQAIAYPTDTGLLNMSRKRLEKMIDQLYKLNGKEQTKPRTYRQVIDKLFLSYSKNRRKSKSDHRKMRRKLLESVNRDVSYIETLLDKLEESQGFPLAHNDQRMLWVIKTVYQQQKQMQDDKTTTCPDRIVSIHQPQVRPIPRGKTKSQTEFGSKLGVSLDNGFARLGTLSWNAYREGKDLIPQVEAYRVVHGYYPELVQVDKAYASRENRKWLKERGIRITANPLGRKKEQTAIEKRKHKKEAAERNHIEGKFGQGKNGYNLNQIRAKLQNTSESWIATIFYVMNLINYQKLTPSDAFYEIIKLWHILNTKFNYTLSNFQPISKYKQA